MTVIGHTQTGPWFKMSLESLEKQRIDLATLGLVSQCIIHYSTIVPADERLLAYYLIAFCESLLFFSRKKSTEDEPLFLEVALKESDC